MSAPGAHEPLSAAQHDGADVGSSCDLAGRGEELGLGPLS